MSKAKTVEEYRTKIEDQLEQCGPYSHNLIGLYLSSIAEHYGTAEANQAIEDLGLEDLGWSKVQEP